MPLLRGLLEAKRYVGGALIDDRKNCLKVLFRKEELYAELCN